MLEGKALVVAIMMLTAAPLVVTDDGRAIVGDVTRDVTDIFTDPEQRVKKTLGQFSYEIVDGQIKITDQFNFNDAPEERQDIPLTDKIKTIIADIEQENLTSNYGKVRKAAQHLGSPEGQGALFNLKINL